MSQGNGQNCSRESRATQEDGRREKERRNEEKAGRKEERKKREERKSDRGDCTHRERFYHFDESYHGDVPRSNHRKGESVQKTSEYDMEIIKKEVTGLPRALEIMEILENQEKVHCMKNHGI